MTAPPFGRGRRYAWTAERLDALRALLERRASMAEMSQALGCSACMVKRAIPRYLPEAAAARRRVRPAALIATVEAGLRAGLAPIEIARREGLGAQRVHDVVSRYLRHLRAELGNLRRADLRAIPQEQIDAVAAGLRAGLGQAEIARRTGLPPRRVYGIVNKRLAHLRAELGPDITLWGRRGKPSRARPPEARSESRREPAASASVPHPVDRPAAPAPMPALALGRAVARGPRPPVGSIMSDRYAPARRASEAAR